jgi:hypothetical protein
MTSRSWIDPRVAQVRVDAVRSYMLQHGWTLQPFPGPELLVFGGQMDDDGEPIELVLPSKETMLDYRMRVEDLIGALGVLEDRYAGDVLNDILQAGASAPAPTNGAAAPVTPSPTTGR